MKTPYFYLTLLSLPSFLLGASFQESVYSSWGQRYEVDKVLYQEKTQHQDLIIFENSLFGRVMALDGAIQVTEKDEFIYHETLAHIPIFSHANPKSVLVIGGGDGGIIREVLKHKSIDRVVLVELDEDVVTFSKKHLPFISKGSFEDPRLELIIDDGAHFIKTTEEKFDVILVDSPDPVGEALSLFTKEFYHNCYEALHSGGVFANQAGVPFMQKDELELIHKGLTHAFSAHDFFFATVPTYIGGQMAFGFAVKEGKTRSEEEQLRSYTALKGSLMYYSPEIHKASFARPVFLKDL